MAKGNYAPQQGEFRQLSREKEAYLDESTIELEEGAKPDPIPEPRYQNLRDGVRVTIGGQSRDYRGGLDIVTLRGKSIRIVVSHENKDLHGAYSIRDEIISFGKSAMAELEADPDLFWSACIHELAHMRYFDLDGRTQKEVNDFIVGQFSRELVAFQTELYSAKGGEHYAKEHAATNVSTAVPFRYTGGGITRLACCDRQNDWPQAADRRYPSRSSRNRIHLAYLPIVCRRRGVREGTGDQPIRCQ